MESQSVEQSSSSPCLMSPKEKLHDILTNDFDNHKKIDKEKMKFQVVESFKSICDFAFDDANNKTTPIRIELDENNNPWFCGKDVCDCLTISEHRRALARIDNDERGVLLTHSLGGDQTMVYVNESGLYSLILGSRKKEAKIFKRWITHDVLPSIRKYGMYATDPVIANLQKHPEKITELLVKLDEHKQYIDQQKIEYEQKEKDMQTNYNKLEVKHRRLKKTRTYYKFKTGQCFYILYNSNNSETTNKVGITVDINRRLQEHRTNVPYYKLMFLIYVQTEKIAKLLESLVKTKFECDPKSSEIVVNAPINELIEYVKTISNLSNILYEEESNLVSYNEAVNKLPNIDITEENDTKISVDLEHKKCTRCEIERKFQEYHGYKNFLEGKIKSLPSWCRYCSNESRKKNYVKSYIHVSEDKNKRKMGVNVRYIKNNIESKIFKSMLELSKATGIDRHIISKYIKSGEMYNEYRFINVQQHATAIKNTKIPTALQKC